MRTFLQALAIVLLSSLTALAYNHFRSDPLDIARFNPLPDSAKEAAKDSIPTVSLEEAKQLFDVGSVVFVDARPPEEFAKGRVQFAMNLPEKELDRFLPTFLQSTSTQQPLIVYCDGHDCLASNRLAKELLNRKYQSVKVMTGGWQGWVGKAYPIEW